MTRSSTHATAPERSRRSPAVSHPHDPAERQAELAADVVASGGSVASWSFASVPLCGDVHRQETADAPKPLQPEEHKGYDEAAKKAVEAALETPAGKKAKELVLADPLVKKTTDFITTPVGLLTGGVLLGGALGGLAAAKQPLPFQLPAVPLEKIHPSLSGISGQVKIEGPLNAPTFVGLTLTFGGGSSSTSSQRDERPIQRSATSMPTDQSLAADGGGLERALESGGRALDPPVRHSMEARFGHDFSAVRIHDDASANAAADRLQANALTLGDDVVFAAGAFDARSPRGQRLLAHELVHVVQQHGRRAGIHRDDKAKPAAAPKRKGERDVVLMLLFPPRKDLAATVAKGAEVITADTAEQLAEKLKKITYPIGTVYVIAHGLESGDIGFETASATSYVLPEKLAKALTGSLKPDLAPQLVDFRSCSVGTTPTAIDAVRRSLGAQAAIGGTCYLVDQPNGPIKIGGKAITRPAQVTAKNRSEFEAGLKKLGATFGGAEKCIVERTEDAYFRAGGKWVAQWYNPEFETTFHNTSICRNEIKPKHVDPKAKPGKDEAAGGCQIIRVGAKP